MGMFDSLIVKKPLPLSKKLRALKGIKWDETIFQTKDFDCTLSTFEITKSGRLRTLKHEYEWVDDDNSFLKGYMKSTKDWWEFVNDFTGTVDFYEAFTTDKNGNATLDSYNDEVIDGTDWWVEFTATIVKGKVTEIKLLKEEATPARIRIIQHKEWEHERKKKEAKLSYRIISFLRKSKTYCILIRSLYNGVNKLASRVSRFLLKL
jgi:hypothetical protein